MGKADQSTLFSNAPTLNSKIKLNILKIFSATIIVAFCSCSLFTTNSNDDINYKQEMRDFVKEISGYSKNLNANFIIIPQNGIELLTHNGEENGSPNLEYLEAIDCIGQEDLYYGYNIDDQATPLATTNYIRSFLDLAKDNQIQILIIDYCSTYSNIDESYNLNIQNGYVSFAANHRELDNIPKYPDPILNENGDTITSLNIINNFLYLINPSEYPTKQSFIDAITQSNYDLIIMDYFFNDEEWTKAELNELRRKANGGERLVISYMSIGEAEDYRYYWQSIWNLNSPEWLSNENPDWAGNYKVKYWMQSWKKIIYGNTNSYLDKIIDKGFDGVYLDIIDAFEYFENQ